MGKQPSQLCDPSDAARPNHTPCRQLLEGRVGQTRLDDEAVHRVLPLEDRANLASVGEHGRDVLETVHEHVHSAVEQRDLELLRPERLATEEIERLRLVLVALGRHERRSERVRWEGRLERGQDGAGLDLSELGRPGREGERRAVGHDGVCESLWKWTSTTTRIGSCTNSLASCWLDQETSEDQDFSVWRWLR